MTTQTIPLTFAHVTPQNPKIEPWEHGLLWHNVTRLEVVLGDVHWYGQGGLVHQAYPLDRIAQYRAPFLTSDNGATGLSGILHPFWFNADGVGLAIEGSDHLTTSFNAPLDGIPEAHSFATNGVPHNQRPKLSAHVATDGKLCISADDPFTVRFFLKQNPRQVVEAFWGQLTLAPAPPDHFFQKTLWTTWAHFKNDISAAKILDFAERIQANGYQGGHLGIDAKWQDEFGSTAFDRQKFPDPVQTVAALHQLGLDVTLWCIPFFHPQTDHYATATQCGYVVQGDAGETHLQTWWEGDAALLNVLSAEAITWHLDNLQMLAESVGVDGFKFDAGEGMFYWLPGTSMGLAGNTANHIYIEQLAKRFPWSDVRSGWFNQSAPMLFRQWDKSTRWGYDNGLASCITQAIALNMLGYRFSFPDMIGGNQYGDDHPSAELLIRWTQAVAPMPIIQFSIPPWDYGAACNELCARYAQLHTELAPQHIALAQQLQPMVRPIWWIAPSDPIALTVNDSYLVGNTLLVAPIVEPNQVQRDIYLPEGTWQSYWNPNEVHQGGQWLRDYPAPLDTLPLFVLV